MYFYTEPTREEILDLLESSTEEVFIIPDEIQTEDEFYDWVMEVDN